MKFVERLLIPVVDTEASRWVLPKASQLLRRPHADVTLLSVVGSERASVPAAGALAEIAAPWLHEGITVRTQVRVGEPVAEILAEAALGYDLIVMSTHSPTGIDRLLTGSVALRVLRGSTFPMLLFHPLQRADGSLSSAETANPVAFRSLLIPLDGSPAAEEILPIAGPLALGFKSRIVLFTAIPGGPGEAGGRKRAEERLTRAREHLAEMGLAVSTEIRVGAAAREALEVIRKLKIDAVAMTTHGRTGTAHARYGSVAESLIRKADVPMLVIRNRLVRGQEPTAFRHPADHYELK